MMLQYVFIEKYRNFEHQGFNFSGQFHIEYSQGRKEINVREIYPFIAGFFGPSVGDIKVLVGENGVGKSSLLTFLVEELAHPKSEKSVHHEGFVILYDAAKRNFVSIGRGETYSSLKINVPEGYRKDKRVVSKKFIVEDKIHDSVLSRVAELHPMGLVLFSNIFDNRIVSSYGPPRSPFVIDLTTNALVKNVMLDPLVGNFKSTVNSNAIRFVVGSQSENFIPAFRLPEKVNVIVNFYAIDTLIGRGGSKGSNMDKPLKDFLVGTVYHNKRERIAYWLLGNFLVEIWPFLKGDDGQELIQRLRNANFVQEETTSFFSVVRSFAKELSRSARTEKRKLPPDFSWPKFISDYEQLYHLVLELLQEYDDDQQEFNTFNIPLNKTTIRKIDRLSFLIDRSVISVTKVSLTWNDLSTGETMLLNFFSNLFILRRKLKPEDVKTLWFLFDEVDAFFHPQWQKRLMKSMLDFFAYYYAQFKIQIVMTAHSPLIISDFPKSNVLFMKKSEDRTQIQDKLDNHIRTFGANIHSLLSDSFFLKGGHIGDFANSKIVEVIDLLVDRPLNEVLNNRDYIEKVINLIGEEVIRNKLIELLQKRVNANLLSIKKDVDDLKNRK